MYMKCLKERENVKILKFNDNEFPNSLKNITNPPSQLWVEGNINILGKNAISIVGSRSCTKYGERWCEKFVKGLLEYDLVIVSGMAIGIDSIAHNTALKYGGKTIAVLPTGFENIYPKENIKLYEKIKQNGGAIVSEYPPYEKQNKNRFLERNRIVSGLGIATLVIEASYRSGTSVTAGSTILNNKKVFCVPGSLDNSKSLGTNIMIKKGANLVTCVEDIVGNFDFLYKIKTLNIQKNEEDIVLDDVDDEYKDVYKMISDIPSEINIIARKLNLPIDEVMAKISMLEINEKIKRVEGSKFVKF